MTTRNYRRRHDVTVVRAPMSPWLGCGLIFLGFVLGAMFAFFWLAVGLASLM